MSHKMLDPQIAWTKPPSLVQALTGKNTEILDLTTPLCEETVVIKLPDTHGQATPFRKTVISRYDERGPTAFWHNIEMSEHTGTHFDAPIHWLSGRAYDDVSQVPVERLIRPACVLDCSAEAAQNPDFLLTRDWVEDWCATHGPLVEGGWIFYRTGWDRRSQDTEAFLNDGHWPGVNAACARWLAEETDVIGIGTETVGTDAGTAAHFPDQPFPCHWYFQGANKYGLTQLQNLARLPPSGALIIVAPLPIVGGTGSPARVLAVVEDPDE